MSKKFTDDPGITSDTVKQFLELNFTKDYEAELCGSSAGAPRIDPALIMDLRHDAVRRTDQSQQLSC